MAIAFFNDQWLNQGDIAISPLDRGFLFGDGVYEVIPVYSGQTFASNDHYDRLQQSLDLTAMPQTLTRAAYHDIMAGLIDKNSLQQGAIYLQISRGSETQRQHLYQQHTQPTVMAIAMPEKNVKLSIKICTLPDQRWANNCIKSINLLANVMALHQAQTTGYDDCILIQNDQALEAPCSNLIIVQNHQLITPPTSANILAGITRKIVIHLAKANGVEVIERTIIFEELSQADEIWLTSSTQEIRWAHQINDKLFKYDTIPPLWHQMNQWYQAEIKQQCG